MEQSKIGKFIGQVRKDKNMKQKEQRSFRILEFKNSRHFKRNK